MDAACLAWTLSRNGHLSRLSRWRPSLRVLHKNPNTLYVNPHKDAVAFRYYGDGTGRDSYVVADSGGLIPKYVSKGTTANFTNSLRQPDATNAAASSLTRKIKFENSLL